MCLRGRACICTRVSLPTPSPWSRRRSASAALVRAAERIIVGRPSLKVAVRLQQALEATAHFVPDRFEWVQAQVGPVWIEGPLRDEMPLAASVATTQTRAAASSALIPARQRVRDEPRLRRPLGKGHRSSRDLAPNFSSTSPT